MTHLLLLWALAAEPGEEVERSSAPVTALSCAQKAAETGKLELITDFTLARTNVDPMTIDVKVDGQVTDYTYTAATNEVHVGEPGIALSVVDISYCLKQELPVPEPSMFPSPSPEPSITPSPDPSPSPEPSPVQTCTSGPGCGGGGVIGV